MTCILCMDFAMAVPVLLLENTKGVFPVEGFRLEVYLCEFTRHCVMLVVFRVFLCSLKGLWYERLTPERTFIRWFREFRVCPPVEWSCYISAAHSCAMYSAWNPKNNYDMCASVFIVQFNGFVSLTSYFDVKYRY